MSYSPEEFIFDFLSHIIEDYSLSDEDAETFRGVLQYIALMVPRDENGVALPMQEQLSGDEESDDESNCKFIDTKKQKTS